MNSLFIQLHTLTSYPAALLNRDDLGFAKRTPFGGVTRTRISSQCLKRHWRTFAGEGGLGELGIDNAVRSRLIFQRLILDPLIAEGKDRRVAQRVVDALSELIQKTKAEDSVEQEIEETAEPTKTPRTQQLLVLGRSEIEFLLSEARRLCDEGWEPDKNSRKEVGEAIKSDREKNLKALARAAGLDAALFGRMVTSDILARGDAAVHVAHAFTFHGESAESDYFSAVDDLQEEGETGEAHINSTELTTGLFYGYVVIDVPLLVSNLEGCHPQQWRSADRQLAGEVVARLVRLIATVPPGAKKGSTAPYAFSHLVLAESGGQQPRTLANAFLKPVPERPDVVANAYGALGAHVEELDRMYGTRPVRCLAALGDGAALGRELGQAKVNSLDEVAQWAAAQVRGW